MHVAAWHRRTPESRFTKFGEEMSTGQTPNCAKFCGDPTRIVRDICDRKFGKKVDRNSPKSLKTCYAITSSTMPNFIEIGITILKKSITKIFTSFNIFTPQGDPLDLGQRSPVWVVMYINPPLANCKILPVPTIPLRECCQTSLILLPACPRLDCQSVSILLLLERKRPIIMEHSLQPSVGL